ncbi:MAG: hypothetical protein HY800_02485, partial [Ignavibacteriales bacterium]|nr:hypothetical protein [Ignavibacteriales bacterium]
MSSLEVRPIGSKAEFKRLFRSNWVPPLLMDRRKLIDKKKNPFYQHSESEFFLAHRDGRIVGRIAAIINHNHNKEHNDNIGFFGFFESINDQRVADALFTTAKQWLKTNYVDAMRGPANPSVNDEYGLLIDGFDRPPILLMPYNPPYYSTLIEGAGLAKAKDLYAYHVCREKAISEKLSRVTEKVRQREGLTFRSIDMKRFDEEVSIIKDLYNRAWQYNWGAVKMTDEEFDFLAKDLKQVIIPELVIIAEYKDEPVGFSLSLPDLNTALKYNKKGYLIPGIARLMWHKKKINW